MDTVYCGTDPLVHQGYYVYQRGNKIITKAMMNYFKFNYTL